MVFPDLSTLNCKHRVVPSQFAAFEADVAKLTCALSEANQNLGKERTHRQDLQNRVVDYDRKLAALESEKKRLLLD